MTPEFARPGSTRVRDPAGRLGPPVIGAERLALVELAIRPSSRCDPSRARLDRARSDKLPEGAVVLTPDVSAAHLLDRPTEA